MDTATPTRSRLSGEELLARARALAPRFRARRDATARNRIVPPETIAELREAQLFRALQPAVFGGHEIDLVEFLDILDVLGQSCGSTAWVYSVLTAHCVWIACFPEKAQQEIWGDNPATLASSALLPSGVVEPVAGGFRLGGEFPFSSGCDYAQWALVGALEDPKGAATAWAMAVPMSELEIVDDWHVIGLEGTGSKTLRGKNIFVPSHRAILLNDATEGRAPGAKLHDGPVFKCPRASCSPYSLIGVGLGIAQGAVNDFVSHMQTRKWRGQPMAEIDAVQLKLAESDAEVDAARLMLRRNCIDNMTEVRRTGTLSLESRTRNRRDHGFAGKLCLQAVDRLHLACGAHGLFQSSPLQQGFRDMHAVAAHAVLTFEPSIRQYGRVRLGLDLDDTFFV